MIRLQKVEAKDRDILWNINQKYLYEMTNYYDDPMDEHGNYHYGHFDEYFSDPKRVAYFIYVGMHMAVSGGFRLLDLALHLQTRDYFLDLLMDYINFQMEQTWW